MVISKLEVGGAVIWEVSGLFEDDWGLSAGVLPVVLNLPLLIKPEEFK
jgi:hypothetical protein